MSNAVIKKISMMMMTAALTAAAVEPPAEPPPAQRSISQLKAALELIAEKRLDQALQALQAIAANGEFPKLHRDEATALTGEVERLKNGLPARDPEATRVRVAPAPKPGRTLHVLSGAAPDGNGSRKQPFSSLQNALQAAAVARKKSGGTEILLAPGRYPVTKGIRLDTAFGGTAGAPLVIRSAIPGKAVLHGGVTLKGFQPVTDPEILKRLPEEARDKVRQCDLKSLGITEYGKLAVRGCGVPNLSSPPTVELFSNGKPQTLARWPNEGFVKAAGVADPGNQSTGKPSVMTYAGDRPARWTTAKDAWLFGYFRFLWADGTLPIASVDPAARTITTAGAYKYEGGMDAAQGILYYAFNLLEELDHPGEWFLDRQSGLLYWYPDHDPATADVELSVLEDTMLSAQGLRHVRLEGLVFECGRFNGLQFRNCQDLLIAGCIIRRMAGNGITIEGGARNQLVACDIHTLGRRGCEISGGDRPTLTRGDHVVVNSRFRDVGRIDRTYTPAIQLEGVGNRIAHNLFENLPSSAIRVEGNDHLIELNEFSHVVLESDDQGVIDMWRNPTYRGIIYRHNLFADIGDDTGLHAGQGGIRFDDIICGMTVYGNVFLRASRRFGGVQMNCGRDNIIDNNLFLDCQVAVSGGYGAWNKHWASAKSNPPDPDFLFSDLYRSRYPELNRLFVPPFLNHMWRNAIIRCGREINYTPEAFDRVADVVRAEDPGFLKGRDLNRQAPPSLFESLGLTPIPLQEIGLYDDALRMGWSEVN